MNKPRSTLSESLFYLFDLYLVILLVAMLKCSVVFHSRRKEGLFFSSLGGVVPMFFFFVVCLFVYLVPNLLRKAAKVEGTQEGIVGTKHSQEQLDVSYQFHPSLLILTINVLTDV